MSEGTGAVLADVRVQLRQHVRPPFELLQIVVFNMALVVFCWFVLGPDTISRLSGLIFLPAVMASWAFADVPATNLYGSDPAATLAVLDDEAGLRRLILVRNVTLWLIVSPAVALLALVLAWDLDQMQVGILVFALVLGLPLGFLAGTAIMAPLLPYHQLSVRERLARRDTWLRWGVCVVLPYFLITPAALLLLAPGYLIYHALGETTAAAVLALVVITAWTWTFRRLALDLTLRLTAERRESLRAFLSEPARG